MTRLLFDGDERIRVLQVQADDRFGGGELWELLAGVRKIHPAARVFVILGLYAAGAVAPDEPC